MLKNEVLHAKKSVEKILQTANPTLQRILEHYFGLDSSIHLLFKNEIDSFKDHKTFLNFIATCLFLAWNDSSSYGLLRNIEVNETFSDLIKSNSLSSITHNKLWKEIVSSGLG